MVVIYPLQFLRGVEKGAKKGTPTCCWMSAETRFNQLESNTTILVDRKQEKKELKNATHYWSMIALELINAII